MNKPNRPFFPVLTGLRAVAAYLVFFNHYPLPAGRLGNFVYYFCQQLYIGVSFFFVLSGFLITIRYEDQIWKTKSQVFNYFRNRFARIYPMYFLVTTFTFWYYVYHLRDLHNRVVMDNPAWVYICNITFIRGFFNDLVISGVAQGWTLTIEECFYALAPVIFILSTKWKLRYQVLTTYFLGILLWLIFRNVKFYGFFGSLNFISYYSYFGRCLELFLGVAIARLYKRKKAFPVIKKHFTVIGGLFVIVTTVLLEMAKGDSGYAIFYPQGIFINNFILPFAIAILFWGLLHERTVFSKLLGSKTFLLLGKSSYSFYLIHMGVFSELLYKYVTGNYLLNFPLFIVISIILFKLVEEPVNTLIRGQ